MEYPESEIDPSTIVRKTVTTKEDRLGGIIAYNRKLRLEEAEIDKRWMELQNQITQNKS